MRSGYKLFTLVLVLALISSCYYDKENELYPNSVCDLSVTTFSGAISGIISTNCAISGCHVASGQAPDLTTYANIYGSRDQINLHACIQKDMPKGSSLPSCDIKKLQAWINAGAPNN
jgi:hypothetical protein